MMASRISYSITLPGMEVRLTSGLISIPGKILDQIIKLISKHLEDNKEINNRQHAFVKSKSCQTCLIFFHDRTAGTLNKGKEVDAIY